MTHCILQKFGRNYSIYISKVNSPSTERDKQADDYLHRDQTAI